MEHSKSGTSHLNHATWIRNSRGAASPELEQRPSKRLKRGNYVSNACGECQRRKIKCDGSIPCQPCVLNDRNCRATAVDMRRRKTTPRTLLAGSQQDHRTHVDQVDDEQDEPTTKELASRLDRIERQLGDVLSVVSHRPFGSADPEMTARENNQRKPVRNHASRTPNNERDRSDGFFGETSINHTLGEIEGYLRHVRALHPQPEPSASSEASLFLPLSPRVNHRYPSPSEILRAHNISPDIRQWSIFTQGYCDEVHVLFPFLHLPTLWTNHTTMWGEYLLTQSVGDSDYTADKRVMIAQIWVCIAIGKCTASPRSNAQEGKHSSGWSLYTASLDLIGDLFRSFQDCSDQMLVLQTFALMVVYLFRVDANERAEKFLSVAISHAHHLGLHRARVHSTMSVYNSELFRRLWWCLYVLDRRMAIETGHPVLIHDVNVDAPHPQNLGDGWLTAHQDDQKSCLDLSPDINAEVNRDIVTPIPYLVATIHYSQVVGRVWKALYGARDSNSIPESSLINHLEGVISQAQKNIHFEYPLMNQERRQVCHSTSHLPWWRVKQQMVMRIRWLCLRLLIRKPTLRETGSLSSVDNHKTCTNIAREILQEFREVPEAKSKSAFTFLHYLVGATMVSLSLIVKQPESKEALGDLTLQAASSLKWYCQNTWVSGKMARTIWKLNEMIKAVMQSHTPSRPRSSPAQGALDNCASNRLTSRGVDALRPTQNVFRESNPDQAPHLIVGTSPETSAMPNSSIDFSSNAPLDQAQPPDYPFLAGTSSLPMTDFDFEESANTAFGIHSSLSQRPIHIFPQDINHNWLSWPDYGAQPTESVDPGQYWLQAFFGTGINGAASFLGQDSG